jgi:hypothetical protein
VRSERSPAFESGGEPKPSRANPENNEMLATNAFPLLQNVRKLFEGEVARHELGIGGSLITAVYSTERGLLVLKHSFTKKGAQGCRASSEDARHPRSIWQ